MSNVAGIVLFRSVHVDSDDTARELREAARWAGATTAQIAEALALRDQRITSDVVVLEVAS